MEIVVVVSLSAEATEYIKGQVNSQRNRVSYLIFSPGYFITGCAIRCPTRTMPLSTFFASTAHFSHHKNNLYRFKVKIIFFLVFSITVDHGIPAVSPVAPSDPVPVSAPDSPLSPVFPLSPVVHAANPLAGPPAAPLPP